MTRKDQQQLLDALHVDLDGIDRVIEAGHYTSRADFLRAAISNLIKQTADKQTVISAAPVVGLHFAPGTQVSIRVIGVAVIHTAQEG